MGWICFYVCYELEILSPILTKEIIVINNSNRPNPLVFKLPDPTVDPKNHFVWDRETSSATKIKRKNGGGTHPGTRIRTHILRLQRR